MDPFTVGLGERARDGDQNHQRKNAGKVIMTAYQGCEFVNLRDNDLDIWGWAWGWG